MLVGNWIFALAFFLTFKFAWHWVPTEWNTPGDKIALVFQCAAFALLPGVVAICIVAAQRLNPEMWVGRTAKPNSALDINTRFILNTFEQFTAYLVAIAVVALYSPPEGARALPILTALVRARTDLVLGRIPQASLSARLRLWDHLLPNRCNLYLVCPAHSVRHSDTSVLIALGIINHRVRGLQSTIRSVPLTQRFVRGATWATRSLGRGNRLRLDVVLRREQRQCGTVPPATPPRKTSIDRKCLASEAWDVERDLA